MLNTKPTRPAIEETATGEICLNLWWLLDPETGIVCRIAGRAYSLTGTDEQKIELLQRLAIMDYYSAELVPLPERYNLIINGSKLSGATMAMTIDYDYDGVFREVINKVEAELPAQTRLVNGQPETYRFQIPQNVVMVRTCVHELADGRLIAQISN